MCAPQLVGERLLSAKCEIICKNLTVIPLVASRVDWLSIVYVEDVDLSVNTYHLLALVGIMRFVLFNLPEKVQICKYIEGKWKKDVESACLFIKMT